MEKATAEIKKFVSHYVNGRTIEMCGDMISYEQYQKEYEPPECECSWSSDKFSSYIYKDKIRVFYLKFDLNRALQETYKLP